MASIVAHQIQAAVSKRKTIERLVALLNDSNSESLEHRVSLIFITDALFDYG